MPNPPIDYATKINILRGRTVFADYVVRRKLLNEGRVTGGLKIVDASVINELQVAAVNTTPAELNTYLASVDNTPPPPPEEYTGPFIQSRNITTDEGFTIGRTATKDMSDDVYTYEFDPNIYQADFFPGMTDFIDGNIVAGDKSSEDRLMASYWDDLGNDVFDDWGFFYIYDVESGKYYFPLINPQNQDDGVITTQTFSAFGRTFTIAHGWAVQGIFKFDITANDSKPFRFGAYGNMGSDGDEVLEDLTYSYTLSSTNLTLYYKKHQEAGDSREILWSYFIPKRPSQNATVTYDYYNNEDDDNIMSKEINNGLIVYFSKSNDVHEWVANDLQIV